MFEIHGEVQRYNSQHLATDSVWHYRLGQSHTEGQSTPQPQKAKLDSGLNLWHSKLLRERT